MSVGSVVVGGLVVVVVVGLLVMKFQMIRLVWSAGWDLFKRRR